MDALVFKILVAFIAMTVFQTEAYRCDAEFGKLGEYIYTSGKYFLKIEDSPEAYVPNKRYQIIITLDTYTYPYLYNKFKNFILTLDSLKQNDDDDEVSYDTGRFELGEDMLSKFSESCKNTVTAVNLQTKYAVKLYWHAPPPNSGCVNIRATVIEPGDKWYADDSSATGGHLTKTLCEDTSDDEDTAPEVLQFCPACDEAKYELAFEGNWIRNTHPKGFPTDTWTTKFSDLIGSSHRLSNGFWQDFEAPGEGLKDLVLNENIKKLESELMGNMENIRTIIKARGLEHPNMRGSSYAIFRVDNENHLVSLVSKMIPSPDWIVGVSNFELCQSDGTWKPSRTFNLYPRDVGTDDGIEYTEKKPSENEPVITPMKDLLLNESYSRSPFYEEAGQQIPPVAKMHFNLLKVFKKECDPNRTNPEPEEETNGELSPSSDKCAHMGWGTWSTCSALCGKGHMTRSIRFKNTPSAEDCPFMIKEETKECDGESCSNNAPSPYCPNIVWEPWSSCNETCGVGVKTRLRLPSRTSEEENQEDKECPNKEEVQCNEGDCKNEV